MTDALTQDHPALAIVRKSSARRGITTARLPRSGLPLGPVRGVFNLEHEGGHMADETARATGESDEQELKSKKQRGLDVVVMKEIRRARRLFQDAETADE